MHKILVIRHYFYYLLDALHVSDCVSPSLGADFISCTSQGMPVYADTSGCCVTIATQQPGVWYRHIPRAMYSL